MIAILDYGMGNLRSVEKAFGYIGINAIVTNEKRHLMDARAIIIPGVGAFYNAIENLKEKGLIDSIINEVNKGKPLLGICLGMQILFQRGSETEACNGLGLLEGDVIKIPPKFKIPHMGWNKLHRRQDSRLLQGLEEDEYVYFVHSFYVKTDANDIVKGVTQYGVEIPAVIEKDNVFAMQFHPEKSGDIGLKILRNFGQVIK
ncbi:imidazole glycerol phosphate synthase subunit HisH [Alkaliphilus peptidifermentans]|uniref:Imidazole glycerol phosphate synthase subunit HisH n=1 Tax=Alkaliphilus peptidifermentans DSM 18978 TaxID=1120976 RepID=A0A1G5AD17_9FIRM|nr:imidazole glycerol phosphate synthase subunit HisH [Alkaliphilus peptidifermentans]SCX75779.1 imidazole glycerol phosphate synthase subunit hisH [Alkaliphilus peptidifermentans DSM 18978]